MKENKIYSKIIVIKSQQIIFQILSTAVSIKKLLSHVFLIMVNLYYIKENIRVSRFTFASRSEPD